MESCQSTNLITKQMNSYFSAILAQMGSAQIKNFHINIIALISIKVRVLMEYALSSYCNVMPNKSNYSITLVQMESDQINHFRINTTLPDC